MLIGEPHLLRTVGPKPVLPAGVGSLIAAFHVGRWMSIRAYGRWQDFPCATDPGRLTVAVAMFLRKPGQLHRPL